MADELTNRLFGLEELDEIASNVPFGRAQLMEVNLASQLADIMRENERLREALHKLRPDNYIEGTDCPVCGFTPQALDDFIVNTLNSNKESV